MKRTLSILSVVPVIFLAHGAVADCVTVDQVTVPEIRLDPMNGGVGVVSQSFYLTFTPTGPVTGRGLVIQYRISDEDSTPLQRVGQSAGPVVEWWGGGDLGAPRIGDFDRGSQGAILFEDNTSVAVPVTLNLPEPQADLAAGIYRESFTVRFMCNPKDRIIDDAPGRVGVSVAIPNIISANVAGAGSSGQIDFGDFANLSRSLNLSVRSTGPFEIRAESENAGALLRDGAAAPDEADRIPYRVTVDGLSLDLNGGWSSRQPRVGLLGRHFPLEVNVDDVSANRAGEYRDTLRVIFAPKN